MQSIALPWNETGNRKN